MPSSVSIRTVQQPNINKKDHGLRGRDGQRFLQEQINKHIDNTVLNMSTQQQVLLSLVGTYSQVNKY